MNRQEAIEVLKERIDAIEDDQAYSQMSKSMYKDGYRRMDAYRLAIKALSGPQPDPITGLVPCGCGGKAEIGQYCEVTCDKCGASVPANYTEADAKAAWNTAMGRKGGAE